MTKQNMKGGTSPTQPPQNRKLPKPCMGGIYVIQCKATGKRYVGSSVDLTKRMGAHRRMLRNGKHYSPHLQYAWNKHDESNFIFGILAICERDELIDREQFFIDLYQAADKRFGYNVRPQAENWTGHKHTPEAIEKFASKQRGMKKGPCSEERKRKIGVANSGNNYCIGRTMSAETRAKIGAANKGRLVGIKRPPEFGEKIRQAKLGRKMSEETKKKIREAHKRRLAMIDPVKDG